MKKISTKLLKIVMLISMIFSSFQTPIYVLANELTETSPITKTTPEKGDMKLGENGEITKEGTISVTSKSTDEKIEVKKTVTADKNTEGKYRVDFEIIGKENETEIPVYVVLVFDTSGSMCDVNQYTGACKNMKKWNNAVTAAQDFAKTIIDSLPKSKVALVTFDTNATKSRGFEHNYLGTETSKTIFGTAGGGTNLHDGLIKAQEYLSTEIAEADKTTAKKYVVVMSDGQPTYYINSYGEVKGNGSETNKTTIDKTLTTAKEIKTNGTEIYSIGYALPNGDVYDYNYTWNNTTYNGLTAKEILTLVASTDTEDDVKNNTQHYQDASSEDTIVEVFKKIAKNITLPGKNATLTDNIGSNFKFVQELDNTPGGTETAGFGGKYITNQITEITKDKITISFDIEINKDAETGWHQTNAGFKLEYTDTTGTKQTINCNENPYVYWVQAKYDYIVNYYKDSITENNLLASETRQAPAGTIININNVEKDKYLNQAGISHEFSSLTPETITITNDGKIKVINVLYIKVYGDLTVKHIDTNGEYLINPVKTTKEVGTNYTTEAEKIYGYTLTTTPSNKNGIYTKEPIEVTYIYTKNEGKLENVENNEVVKTQINPIIGANSTFNYILTYNGKVNNYLGTATVTITDTLPYEVLNIEYDQEACTYNEETRLLTCTKTVELNENNNVIEARFDVKVTYKNLTSTTNLNILNKAESTLTFNNTTVKDESEVTDTIKSGTVIATYVDKSNNTLSDSVTTTGLIDNEYKTTEKTIYGYTLKEVIGNEVGKYTEEEIKVTYVYTKNEGTTKENKVSKVGPENISSVNEIFDYTLTYNGKITDYVGKATLTLKDTLPYEIDKELSTYEGCTYNNKVLTCRKEYDIDETNQEINEEFKLSLVFKNIDSDKITNEVESTLDYGKETPDKDNDKTETEVFKGTVIAIYIDEENNQLADSKTTTGLADTEYKTNEKTIYGYTLKEVIGNKIGKYIANEKIEVTYVYTKNEGTVENNEVIKTQINPIIGTNSTFKYVLTYNGKVNNYLGTATIKFEDTLPYEVKEINYPESCTYNEETRLLTCTKTVELNENNNVIEARFEIEVTYKNLFNTANLNVLNKVKSTLTFGKTEVTDNSEVEDTIKSGKVTAIYIDEENNQLADSETTTGLIDNEYQTNEKEIYGYTLKEVIGNKTGTYTEEDIEVKYIYSKNEGKTENNEVTKVGPENITSVNGVFNYTLTYNGKITDYVGKATLTLKDTLPYEIDKELSTYEGCTYNNKVLICTKEYKIDETNQEINEEFKLSLIFKNIDSEKVINKVESTLDYGKATPDKDNDKTETELFKGTVIVTYKNKQGENLTENIIKEELAGNKYETETLEFLGYTLTKEPENKNGIYVANQTIYVNYIYDKNIGTSEEHLEKQGSQSVTSINSPFEYKITYNLEIFDYVGEAKIILTDYLPYEIDEEKSILGDTCKYTDGKLECIYLKNITNKDNSKISIEENLILYYKNITSNKVTNRIESLVIYGEKEKFDEDEYTTEIPYGTLKVNYITEEGTKLSQTIITTDIVGANYCTEEKVFDNYYLKEIVGESTGTYSEEETEVTYVYSLIPLPPQTGIENNSMNYLGLFIFTALVLILKRRYL